MGELFFMNLPYNCSDREFREWIESRGIQVESVRIIRDLVSGASPAFAYAALADATRVDEAVAALNGKKMRNHAITVQPSCRLSLAADRRRGEIYPFLR